MDIIIIIIPCIMIPEHIMLIMAIRRKTDTAAAMPVITALLNVNAEVCAQVAEGAVLNASFEKHVFTEKLFLSISATSDKIYCYYITIQLICQAKTQINL